MTSPDPGTTQPFPQGHTPPARASDAEREAVVGVLHDAVARGLLTLAEGEERVATAYATRFRDDLPRLTADLPPGPPPAPVAPGWRALALLTWLQLRSSLTPAVRGLAASPRRLVLGVVALVVALSLAGMAIADAVDHNPYGGHSHHGEDWDDD
jgi:hypothetical protein